MENKIDYAENTRREIQMEINHDKVNINRSVFKKTPDDRLKLKKAKKEHKKLIGFNKN